jgi:2-oxoglutarate/2-oxoacid ferredoxin oxidoreductase subunit alpha
VSGNQAIALGALAGGLRFFAGYPITPASEVMEVLATQLPRVGGACVQAEDEIAALGMVLGAAFAGERALTATSGPGLSLMIEMLGLGTMAELPTVVVDVQRAGPSTGMPTRHEQGDLMLAAFGGHGEVARVVLAPTSVADCFYQTFNALNYADRYQLPVIVLSDQALAVRTENVPRPEIDRLELWPRIGFETGITDDYRRYALGAHDGVSPMSSPGQRGGEYTATGLEHNEHGRPRYDAPTHEAMTARRLAKLDAIAKHAPPPLRHGNPDAPIGIIAWGSTAGPAIEAIERVRALGIDAELLVPRLLRPLPNDQIAPFLAAKQVIIVPEANVGGQFADMLVARYHREVRRVNDCSGAPFRTDEIVAALVAAEDERQSRAERRGANGAK